MKSGDDERPRRPRKRKTRAVSSVAKPRHARPLAGPPADEFDKLELSRHRDLVVHRGEIFARFLRHPELTVLLAINPVLALREFGIQLSPEIADHVLRAVRHPPQLAKRRDELEEALQEALGEPPRPDDPQWLARVLFERLELRPLATDGHEPRYRSVLDPARIERLRALRPAPTWKQPAPQRLRRGRRSRIELEPWKPAVRRMDLDAELPPLPSASAAPKKLSLEELYFYKESHPVARQLLELGIVQRQAFPIHSADSYRRIKRGEKSNAFRGWIRGIRFPDAAE